MSYFVNGVRIPDADGVRLKSSAKQAQALENRWDLLFRQAISQAAKADAERVTAGSAPIPPDFESLLIEHYFQVQIAAYRSAQGDEYKAPPAKLRSELGIRMGMKLRSLRDIMRAYDLWRRGLFKPRRPMAQAKDLKKRYLDALMKTWKKKSEEFRSGGEQTQKEVVQEVREAAQTTYGRAQTIVRTEGTRYWNEARKNYYDRAPDVTHYLFVAIRDRATTPWCTSKTTDGQRGRSGLVYAKGDPLLESEKPPCHWNCRSELLPLNRFNPAHLRLIQDQSIQRRSHKCYPLPPGWRAA